MFFGSLAITSSMTLRASSVLRRPNSIAATRVRAAANPSFVAAIGASTFSASSARSVET